MTRLTASSKAGRTRAGGSVHAIAANYPFCTVGAGGPQKSASGMIVAEDLSSAVTSLWSAALPISAACLFSSRVASGKAAPMLAGCSSARADADRLGAASASHAASASLAIRPSENGKEE